MKILDVNKKCLEKISFMQENLKGKSPHITKNGKWLTNTNGHWTGGFWTGLLWLKAMYAENNEKDMAFALEQAKKLTIRMGDNKTHDMGFIFGPSCVMGNNLETNDQLIEMAIVGAHNMQDLFEKNIGLVLAWDEPGYEGVSIVDTIMNAPLMIWAAKQENNEDLYDEGVTLADTIMKQHIRDDYSIYHVVRWDTKTYEIVERSTHQGYSTDTCWSRGQAWALYGFANMYRYTLKKRYLETSRKLAVYYWDNLDDNLYLPRWDFHFKNEVQEPLDASAASIAASGMLLLARMLQIDNQVKDAQFWKERAKKIIDALTERCLFHKIDKYGLIEQVTVDKPRNSGVGESSMYGDYYFMEALYRYMNFDDVEKMELLY